MNAGDEQRIRNFIQKLTIDTRQEFYNSIKIENYRLLHSLFGGPSDEFKRDSKTGQETQIDRSKTCK